METSDHAVVASSADLNPEEMAKHRPPQKTKKRNPTQRATRSLKSRFRKSKTPKSLKQWARTNEGGPAWLARKRKASASR